MLAKYWTFIRPFTLLVPATGMIAGALIALGAEPKWYSDWSESPWGIVLRMTAGALMAASLNAFSNGINQIFDVEVDRINKPHRLLPSGQLSRAEAGGVSLFCLAISLALAVWINWQCFLVVGAATILTLIYSAPPLRTKSRGFWANVTIAVPRGTLLVVAGWSTVKEITSAEPWYVGSVFGAYFLGAVTTKDFSDIEGDRQGNCRTLPVIYGVHRAVWIISPFFVLPFLAIVPAAYFDLFSGHERALMVLGILLSLWGCYTVYLLIQTPVETLAQGGRDSENHPSWRHMYLMTLAAQSGFVLAYLAG